MLSMPIPTLIVQREDAPDEEIRWEQSVLTIGRDPTNNLVIDDKRVSRRHARFERDDAGFYIHDLESTNGTYLNQQRISGAQLLRNNDEVWVGDRVIIFRDPEATMKGTPPPIVRQRLLEPEEELRIDSKAKEVYMRGKVLDPP